MAGTILEDTRDIVRDRLGGALDSIRVKLSTGHAGACATPIKEMPEAVCCPSSAMAMPFPGKLRGRLAADVVEEAITGSGLRRGCGIATIKALADVVNTGRAAQGFETLEGVDAFNAAEVGSEETVVVVGAFVPFLRELRKIGARHFVLEKDPSTLKPHEMPYFRPAEKAPEVVPQADVLLVTGTTLGNDTLDGLVALAKPTARIVVVGPTVTMVGDAFFERGCHIIGGIKVTDPDAFLDILAEGGSGCHFFGRSAVKVSLRRNSASALARSPARSTPIHASV
ncbi:MAG: DUF364 domain-containing protein [Alphaproteobacteria bacterium]|nr:DUF364 domain-containing protein [Alphaproteobacteria bacterium]